MKYTDGLETERLITRFLTLADASLWVEYCSDPVATRFTSWSDSPEKMALEGMQLAMKRYEEGRYGLQALIHKQTGGFIGMCGLMTQEVNGEMVIEIGYHLLRRFWGQGYATEAARKFRDYGFENNLADSIVSIIHPLNLQSQKVAQRNGMRLVDTAAMFRGNPCYLYRITREEWVSLIS